MSPEIQEALFLGLGLLLIMVGFKRKRNETLITLGAMSVGIGLMIFAFTPI